MYQLPKMAAAWVSPSSILYFFFHLADGAFNVLLPRDVKVGEDEPRGIAFRSAVALCKPCSNQS